MATLVLTTVGTALGGPIGGALGSFVGQSIDQGLFGPGIRKGPRLGDLSVQTSSYGSPIPRIYGTMRVAGTVVWATDLKETEVIEGGGKGGPERQSYAYSVNFAVAVSSRPIKSVRRIWADGKLIRGAAGDFKVWTGFRLAQGDEDQAVDPLIASVEGIDQTPAYRSVALAIFEDLELAEFGNRIPMLTFEIEADEAPIPLQALLYDASGGLIEAADNRPIAGFAAHGTSIRDSLEQIIQITGAEFAERNGRLRTAPAATPALIASNELGCDASGETIARTERHRAPSSALPAGLAMTYYDPDRDYQTGQMRASSGGNGSLDQRIELPAVLTAEEAKLLVERVLARRWQAGDKIRLRLPPSRMALRPGDAIQLSGSARSWTIQNALIDGFAVAIEAAAAPVSVQSLPADPGRVATQPDLIIGRSELALFELPADGNEPAESPRAYVAASNAGLWKSLAVELMLGPDPVPGIAITRRGIIGRTETALQARRPMILDELSDVTVQLSNSEQVLLNADADAIMAGANLALVGEELIQFGRADLLGPGMYRLSKLMRGRRGTEWAAVGHIVGEPFCLIDPAAVRHVDLAQGAVGGTFKAIAHGIGDAAPLPMAERLVSGEEMRPPSPCHLTVMRLGSDLSLSWVRRSYRNWAWTDGIGDSADSFPELYRVALQGLGGEAAFETASPALTLAPSQLPAQPGQSIAISVVTVGPAALSRPASAAFTL